MPIHRVDIEPLDPLLFGDNRSARAGADHLQLDQDPSPLAFHGALGQFALDRSGGWPCPPLGGWQADVLAPTAPMAELLGVCQRTAGGSLLFPRPEHLRCRLTFRGRPQAVDLLSPAAPAGETSAQPDLSHVLLPPTRDEEVVEEVEAGVLLAEEALGEVLCGHAPSTDAGLWLENEVVRPEPRPGIAVDNSSGTVVEGAFFTRPYRRYRSAGIDPRQPAGAGFTAWWKTLTPLEAGNEPIAFLGGDRRRARLRFDSAGEEAAEILSSLASRVVEAATEGTSGVLLYLLTPAIATGEPFLLDGEPPIAAAIGRARQASGWDTHARQPRPILNLVPAGSVFFYPWPEGAERASLVRRRWLQPVQERGGAVGFGRALVGVWR